MMWTDFRESSPPKDGRWFFVVCGDDSGGSLIRFCPVEGDWVDGDGFLLAGVGDCGDRYLAAQGYSIWAPMPPGFRAFAERKREPGAPTKSYIA